MRSSQHARQDSATTRRQTSFNGRNDGPITSNEYHHLQSLYIAQLRYLLSTETQIVKGLKSMIKHAQDTQLKQAFQSHRPETEVQAGRLKKRLSELSDDDDYKSLIATTLNSSGTNIVRESSEGPVRDAGLIAAAQKIEH
jgi:ferritin-like metal-binding protein YciE